MAIGSRKRSRIHAVDIASAVNAIFSSTKHKRVNWDRFIETGELKEHVPLEIPITPLIQQNIDRIRANNGRFVAEPN